MDNNNNKIHQIISYLASAASVAVDGVTEVVQGAGDAVGNTVGSVKMSFDISRLHDEQVKLFTDIGRTMFLIKTGGLKDGETTVDGEVVNAQDTVDQLLQQALDKQAEIDELTARRSEARGQKICPNCARVCSCEDVFCAQCGEKLPESRNCGCGHANDAHQDDDPT